MCPPSPGNKLLPGLIYDEGTVEMHICAFVIVALFTNKQADHQWRQTGKKDLRRREVPQRAIWATFQTATQFQPTEIPSSLILSIFLSLCQLQKKLF